MSKILVIDHDPLMARLLRQLLTEHGYQVLMANNGHQGLSLAFEKKPDLVLLDIALPEIDGWAVCRRLRKQSVVPILILTALAGEVERILGLELGADYYLTKPFSNSELMAHIRAILRRVKLNRKRKSRNLIKIGSFQLDMSTKRAFKAGQELPLRHKEFQLLSLLMSKEGQVVSRSELFDYAWGTDWLGDGRTLDVHIRWLRQKIEEKPSKPHYIQTVRGVGYRFISATEAR